MRLYGCKPPLVSHHHAMVGGQSSSTRDITDPTYHVTSQDHVIEGSRNFVSETSSLYVTTLPSLVTIGIVVVEVFLICHTISHDGAIKGQ